MVRLVLWTATALNRVEAIGDHIAHHSLSAAQRTIERLFDAVMLVADQPYRAPRYLAIKDPSIRLLVVRPYKVFYQIREDKPCIVVLTVRHGAQRDLSAHDIRNLLRSVISDSGRR
jgi:plasmid stabilization system protein ParE